MATSRGSIVNGDNVDLIRKNRHNMYNSKVTVVLGAQWGDEGKGKVVDMLATDCDVVCRCQVCFFFHNFFGYNLNVSAFFSSSV